MQRKEDIKWEAKKSEFIRVTNIRIFIRNSQSKERKLLFPYKQIDFSPYLYAVFYFQFHNKGVLKVNQNSLAGFLLKNF